MISPTDEEILACWDIVADDDVSTERALAMAADMAGCDYEDVVMALVSRQEVGDDRP